MTRWWSLHSVCLRKTNRIVIIKKYFMTPNNNNKTIAVVEDQKPIARALRLNLEDAGFQVLVATNGQDGLGLIENEEADLVILDLIMPQLNGFEVLEQLGDNDTSVFVFSNLRDKEDKKRVEELGAEDYLVKSDVQVSDVVDRVQEFLG